MPTANPRVAAYIPQQLKEKFDEFKSEREVKGDSQALIIILSEYFGVSYQPQKVDYSSFVSQSQFDELASKVSEMVAAIEKFSSLSSLTSELPEQLKRVEERIVSLETAIRPTTQEAPPTVDSPGQMALLELTEPSEPPSKPPESESESPKGGSQSSLTSGLRSMKLDALGERLKVSGQTIANAKSRWKDSPDKFTQWTKKKDPDGIPWQYSSKDRLYSPIVNSSPLSFSSSPI